MDMANNLQQRRVEVLPDLIGLEYGAPLFVTSSLLIWAPKAEP